MSLSDPLSDMLTIIRNASSKKRAVAEVKRSRLGVAVLDVLREERFIYDYKIVEDDTQGKVRVYLEAPEGIEGRPLRRLVNIKRVSKPGLRIYAAKDKIPRVLSGLGVSVLSTSKGVMSGRKAKLNKVGGEVLLKVW